MQRRDCGTRILKTSQLVLHKPSRLRQPTCDDVRFELRGDLILDSLVQCLASGSIGGLSTLRRLSGHTPDASVLPAARARETLQQAAEVERRGQMQPQLREHGLGVMEEMTRDDALEMNGRATVREWCVDAEAKQRSFTPMLGDAAVLATLARIMREGVDSGRDTRASVWYKRSIYKRLATTEAPA